MNNKQLLLIKHLLSVKHPFPSCGDRCLIMGEYGNYVFDGRRSKLFDAHHKCYE